MTKHAHDFAKAAQVLKDLPVAGIVKNVVDSVKDGKVTILTAETGSGKTLLASSMLADASDHQVVVLVPRRFLAVNAAESVAEITGTTLGKEVGFAIGQQAGDESNYDPKHTKLLFATYGFAISAGLLDTAKTIVCDEVHEAGIETSLARAIIHRRLGFDQDLRVMEMSATLNAKKQAGYWQDVKPTEMFHAEGHAFPCEFRQVDDGTPIENIARDLVLKNGRKGIAIFCPGEKKVDKIAAAVAKLFKESKINNVEVSTITGDMDMAERAAATAAPQPGNIKVLVGTNVMESGVNIKWLDAGISDGLTKVPYYRKNGAEALVTHELPQWRIIQQEGRVKRFTNGIFVLASKTGMKERPLEIPPEITRISLNGLVMQAASYGITPLGLKFDAPVSEEKLLSAKEDLKRLDVIDDDWHLTEKGKYVARMPLGSKAGSLLYSAPPEIRSDAIELAAITELGGLRADFFEPHGMYKHHEEMDPPSDPLDSYKAFKKLGYTATEEDCAKYNVSWKRYQEVVAMTDELHRRHEDEPGVVSRAATDHELRQMLLHANVNSLFQVSGDGKYKNLILTEGEYDPDRTSVVGHHNDSERFATGYLRELPDRKQFHDHGYSVDVRGKDNKSGYHVEIHGKTSESGKSAEAGSGGKVQIQDITPISQHAFLEFAASREGILTDISFERRKNGRDTIVAKYCGVTPINIGIPQILSPALKSLIEPEYSQFRERMDRETPPGEKQSPPQGKNNTGAWEAQKARTEEARREKEEKKKEKKGKH